RDSCWPGCAAGYTDDNPAWGQCLVSTLLLWAVRGYQDALVAGRAHIPGNPNPAWHFQLEVNKQIVDLTWRQFPPGAVFEEIERGNPLYNTIIQGSFFDDDSLLPRLHLLNERVKRGGFDTNVEAMDIIARLRQVFSPSAPRRQGFTL